MIRVAILDSLTMLNLVLTSAKLIFPVPTLPFAGEDYLRILPMRNNNCRSFRRNNLGYNNLFSLPLTI
jgi:hypothetical protein